MWAHQLFFSNMDYSLKVNALIVSFLIVNFLINSFLKENSLCNALMFSVPQLTVAQSSTVQPHALWEGSRTRVSWCPFPFCLPTQKASFEVEEAFRCWPPAGIQKLFFLPLSWCTGGPAAFQSNLPTTVNYFLPPTFGVFFLTLSFLYFILQNKDWQALPGLPPCVS